VVQAGDLVASIIPVGLFWFAQNVIFKGVDLSGVQMMHNDSSWEYQ
jgi:hypothetical protein